MPLELSGRSMYAQLPTKYFSVDFPLVSPMGLVFEIFRGENKLEKKSRWHEYCSEFRALQNPYDFIEIRDSHVYGGTDPME